MDLRHGGRYLRLRVSAVVRRRYGQVQQARRWLSVLMELGRLMLQATRSGQLR